MSGPAGRGFKLAEIRSFTHGTIIAFTTRVAGAAAMLLLYLAVPRVIGTEGYGRYVFVITWVEVLAALAMLGLDSASLRYVPEYVSQARWRLLAGFVRTTRRTVAGTTIIVAGALAATVVGLGDRLTAELSATFLVGSLLVPLLASLQLTAAQLRGRMRIAAASLPPTFLRPALMCLAVVGLAMLPGLPRSAVTVIGGEVAIIGALAIGSLAVLRRSMPAESRDVDREMDAGRWIRMGVVVMAVAGARMAMSRTDILMLGILQDTTTSGIYALASRMAVVIGFPMIAASTIGAPLFADAHAREDHAGLQQLVTFATRTVTAGTLVTTLGMLSLAPWALRWFGPGFGDALVPLAILAAGQVVNAASGAVGFLLAMTGHERIAARLTIAVALANVGLNAVLIPAFGMPGAAAATMLAGGCWNLLLIREVRLRLGVRSTVLA